MTNTVSDIRRIAAEEDAKKEDTAQKRERERVEKMAGAAIRLLVKAGAAEGILGDESAKLGAGEIRTYTSDARVGDGEGAVDIAAMRKELGCVHTETLVMHRTSEGRYRTTVVVTRGMAGRMEWTEDEIAERTSAMEVTEKTLAERWGRMLVQCAQGQDIGADGALRVDEVHGASSQARASAQWERLKEGKASAQWERLEEGKASAGEAAEGKRESRTKRTITAKDWRFALVGGAAAAVLLAAWTALSS